MRKRRIKSSILALVVLVALILPPSPALAAEPEPDSVSLSGIMMFNDLILTGDFLAFVPYNIPFTAAPDYNISETFIFQVLNADNATILGTTLATPAYDSGYGPGVIAFYIESGMTWGEAYIFRVKQNPVHYPTPQYWDFTTGNSSYSTPSDQAAALRAKVIDSTTSLTPSFGIALLAVSEAGDTILSAAGEVYYQGVIPGLQTMTPSLFSVNLETPDFAKRTWSYTFADALKTKYAGTFLAEFMTGYAGLFTTGESPAINSLSVFLFVFIIMFSVWKFKATMLSAILDGYNSLLLLMLIGFFDMVWAGFMAFILATVGGVIALLKRA
ncbi:hypothetical protein ES703_82654 [subsurface metagenome]